MKTILDKQQLHLTILRLAHQLLENNLNLKDVVFIGIQPRGVQVAAKMMECIQQLSAGEKPQYGILDITFYRDDYRHREKPLKASSTLIDFIVEDQKVILVDDVLYSGRTVHAAMTAIQDRIVLSGSLPMT